MTPSPNSSPVIKIVKARATPPGVNLKVNWNLGLRSTKKSPLHKFIEGINADWYPLSCDQCRGENVKRDGRCCDCNHDHRATVPIYAECIDA